MPLEGCGLGKAKVTLKITVSERSDSVTIQLEGRIAGPWVNELDSTWQKLFPRLDSKPLSLDLRGVTFVDDAGVELLAKIYKQRDGQLLADTPMTRHVAQQVMNGHNGHTA